jgi:hypothetical protein
MEVHAHTHTPRKKWTHYFWEFLMLFLAVFCGFLAEYQLEHIIEKEREHQFIQSLLEDLQNDTTGIQSEYELGLQQKLTSDSIVEFVNTQTISGKNISQLYLLHANSGRVVSVEFETRTSSQLKNAGGMRLIRKKKVADSILAYWKYVEACNAISDRLEHAQENRQNVSVRIFNNKYYIKKNVAFVPAFGILENPRLIKDDPALLAEYSNRTNTRSIVLNNYLINMIWTKKRAVRLMELIRNEYHLK